MSEQPHVHDCTGPDRRCPCGYVFRVPPFGLSIEAWVGSSVLLVESYNYETIDGLITGLRRAAEALESRRLEVKGLQP